MLSSQEVANKINKCFQTVIYRANKLGIKKRDKHWYFHHAEVEMIRNFKTTKAINSTFYFSQDGEFLIINSRMNGIDK